MRLYGRTCVKRGGTNYKILITLELIGQINLKILHEQLVLENLGMLN